MATQHMHRTSVLCVRADNILFCFCDASKMDLLETKLLKHFVKLACHTFKEQIDNSKGNSYCREAVWDWEQPYCCVSFLSWLKGVTEEPPLAKWKSTDPQLPF